MKAPLFTKSSGLLTMSVRVTLNIQAKPDIVWNLLTDAKGFPRWNSTVTGIDGEIREGQRLRVHVPGTKRTFTPLVSGIVPRQRMTWSDGKDKVFKGVRAFTLKPVADGSTDFTMEEKFSGFVFALVRFMLPDFRPIFEAYAHDLRQEAENQQQKSM